MPHPRKDSLLSIARNLRKNMTKEERRLWYDFLRDYPVRFRRQEIIGNYIADFYCSSAALIVELDGSQHYEEKAALMDRKRSAYLETLGLKVLRYSNLDVMRNFRGVCEAIDREVTQRTPQSLTRQLPLQGSRTPQSLMRLEYYHLSRVGKLTKVR